jgi:hypothetical protein
MVQTLPHIVKDRGKSESGTESSLGRKKDPVWSQERWKWKLGANREDRDPMPHLALCFNNGKLHV